MADAPAGGSLMRRGLVVGLGVWMALPLVAGQDLAAVRAYRQRHGAAILAEYVKFLSLPNVAGDGENIRRNARYLVEELRRRGVRSELWEMAVSEGRAPSPIVFGELSVEGAERTLGIYLHYDGQPVDPEEWAHPPFSPTLYTGPLEEGGSPRPLPGPGEEMDPEWRLYARSSGDDKVPAASLLAALDALADAGIAPTSNLKFFFEGEEEAGSPNLESYMRRHRGDLEVDAWLICDGPVHQSRRPQLVFGVRGITGLDLTVYGATRNLHSGHYGNWAPNPALELARLLASLKDEAGRVLVAGFYDSVEEIGAVERKALSALPDYDDELRRELGLKVSEANNAPLVERLLVPSLNVRGMAAAAVGPGARNIIPNTAGASLDLRLVKGNDPRHMQELVEAHIRAQGYHIVRQDPDHETRLAHSRLIKVVRRRGYPAARTAMDLPVVQQVIAAAERAAGEEVLLQPTFGGSLPLYLFTDLLAKPVIIVPMANHDDNQHAPNENLRLANLWYGIDLMAALLTLE